jgi:hypothetical protein
MTLRLSDVTRRSWVLLSSLQQVSQALHPPLIASDRIVATHLLIEVANTWHVFMRRYYLASAVGGYLVSGARVSGGVAGSIEGALDSAVLFFRPHLSKSGAEWGHREEPDWLDPVVVSRALANLSLSNSPGFSAAMSAGSGVHERVLTCRNFVGHRNRRTALKVRGIARGAGILSNADPVELPHLPAPGRPQSLLADWIDELMAIIELVPQ